MRPLVAPIGSVIEMSFESRGGNALLMLDNRAVEIRPGTEVSIARGRYGLRYASLSDNNFINALRAKLLWGEDRRNNI